MFAEKRCANCGSKLLHHLLPLMLMYTPMLYFRKRMRELRNADSWNAEAWREDALRMWGKTETMSQVQVHTWTCVCSLRARTYVSLCGAAAGRDLT
jgi:hypothetical protein